MFRSVFATEMEAESSIENMTAILQHGKTNEPLTLVSHSIQGATNRLSIKIKRLNAMNFSYEPIYQKNSHLYYV